MRSRHLLTMASLLLVLAGCGGGDQGPTRPAPVDDGLPAGTPAADSPEHLVQRLEKSWEFGVEAQYALLLSADFRYNFSASADPVLVSQYPNWTRVDEIASLTHLFHGFVREDGSPVPGMSRMDMTPTGVSVENDPDHADSTRHLSQVRDRSVGHEYRRS